MSRDDKESRKRIKKALFDIQGGLCAICECQMTIPTSSAVADSDFTAHHLKPVSRGGEWVLKNLIGLCVKCHRLLEGHEGETFAQRARRFLASRIGRVAWLPPKGHKECLPC